MSEQPEGFTYIRDEFIDEFVHPDDRTAVEEARQERVLQVRADYLTEMRKKGDRLPGRHQQGYHQAGDGQAQLIGIPAGAGEEEVRRLRRRGGGPARRSRR